MTNDGMNDLPASWAVPVGLPGGRYIVPDPPYHDGEPLTEPALWVTDEPVPAATLGPMYARLLAAHGDTGLWPLLLTEMSLPAGMTMPAIPGMPADFLAHLYPPGRPWHNGEISPVPAHRIDELDAGELLARDWDLEVSKAAERFGFAAGAFPGVPALSWPGLADPASPGADPDAVATGLVAAPDAAAQLTFHGEKVYLGLVPAADGAAAITACGWMSNAGDPAEIAAVIRSWQQRFGVRLCAIGFDTLGLSVAWPPATAEQAWRVAAEHVAFCPEFVYHPDVAGYARDLIGAQVWPFWWD